MKHTLAKFSHHPRLRKSRVSFLRQVRRVEAFPFLNWKPTWIHSLPPRRCACVQLGTRVRNSRHLRPEFGFQIDPPRRHREVRRGGFFVECASLFSCARKHQAVSLPRPRDCYRCRCKPAGGEPPVPARLDEPPVPPLYGESSGHDTSLD